MPQRQDAWLLSYGLLGLTQNGLVPILMPLVSSGNSAAGVTYAAFSLLGLFAPVFGTWADRAGRHRDLLIWGTISSGILLLLFAPAGTALGTLLAAGAGLGAMAATTAGNVLAIQGVSESDWDARVARLQRYISAGQVLGLVAAGVLAQHRPRYGFLMAGIALLIAGGLGYATAPRRLPRNPRDKPIGRPMVGGDAGISASHRHGHHVGWRELGAYLSVIDRRMWRFLIVWLVAYPAMNGFATLFPVAITREFGLNPILPASVYAIGVAMSLLLYAPIGAATRRIGGGRMLIAGLGARLAVLVVLVPLSAWHGEWAGGLILAGFALIQLAWPLLSVAANSLSVHLTPAARGESVGLFNAATSLAAAVGSALAGVVFGTGGFAMLTAVTCVLVGAAIALMVRWAPHPDPAPSLSV